MARSSSGKLDSTTRSSSVKTSAAFFSLRLAVMSLIRQSHAAAAVSGFGFGLSLLIVLRSTL